MTKPSDPFAAALGDELRPVTAVFADIVGSTGLGERLGPDEVKALVGECVTRMSRVVEEFGGTVQAYMGDGICAYFGVPMAHDDDADRAAQAALALLSAVSAYGVDVCQAWDVDEFNVRVGINGGLAAVGMVGAAQPQAVALGDMTNVAARLQSAAAPGTILAGEGTARKLMPRFVLEPMGELSLKGRASPVAAWRVLRRKTSGSDQVPTPLVGREAEVARLRRAADDLIAGRGQSLLLIGDAGIGKSRLLAELRDNFETGIGWLAGECRAYGDADFDRPFVQMVRGWLELHPAEPEIVVRTRLRARLVELYGDEAPDALRYIGNLLSVQLDPNDGERLHDVSAEELAVGTGAAFREFLLRLAREAPIVVAIEGLHEADAATCEMLESLLDLTDRAPVLVVMSMRPETDTPAWRFRSYAMTHFAHRFDEIRLEPITSEAARQLLDVAAPGLLDPTTCEELVSRAEGNPLYLEEMAHALETEEIRPRAWTITAGAAPLPSSLDALLIARIDRLDPDARTLAQTAAVIGREFPARVLEHVVGTERFEAGLPGLLRSGAIREIRRYPELEYSFRHGLLQEAARSTLTNARRATLCARLVEAFEELFAESLDERLEMLAHYHAQSGNLTKALDYLEQAGERSAAWGQEEAAVRLWSRALRVADALDDADATDRLRLALGDRAGAVEPVGSQRSASHAVEPVDPAPHIGPYLLDVDQPVVGMCIRATTEDGGRFVLHVVGSSGDRDAAEWERFCERASAAARVDDRRLVPTLRCHDDDGWRSVAVTWCEGGSLADRIAANKKLSIDETVRIVSRIAVAVDALHREGLVHGGIRPQSILFDGEGRALLVRIALPPRDRDFPGRAPEVLAGGEVTPVSEVYELASIADVCVDHVRRTSTEVPAELIRLIERSRARDPTQRPQSAAMFAQLLRTAQRATKG